MVVDVVVVLLDVDPEPFEEELHAAANNPAATTAISARRTSTSPAGDEGCSVRSPAMTDPRDTESVERVIPAPAEKIFDLLADPSRHREIDGSGSVRDFL